MTPESAPHTAAPAPRPGVGALFAAFVVDVLIVFLFVRAGRATHSSGAGLAAAAGTAWPFWLALVGGWALTWRLQRPAALWPAGVIIWAVTAFGGLAVRGLAGGGLSGGFPYVAAGVLALGLLGWRFLAGTLMRIRSLPRNPAR